MCSRIQKDISSPANDKPKCVLPSDRGCQNPDLTLDSPGMGMCRLGDPAKRGRYVHWAALVA